MLGNVGLEVWAVIAKRVITLLVLAACGLHAYVQYKRRGSKLPTPERWLFLAFSLVFLFGTVANFGAATLTAKVGTTEGPFNFGEFSLLIAVLYVIIGFGLRQRRRY